jgi:hypothetical protein
MRPPRLVFTSELRQSRRSNQRVRGRIDVQRKERLRVGRRLGETPLQLHPAVLIAPGLRLRSPKNISYVGWRL